MLDPAAFTTTIEEHLDTLSPDELREFVLRGIKRLGREERAQLALFLGHGPAADSAGGLAAAAPGEDELRRAVEHCSLLRERFQTFLRDNPRAAHSFRIAAPPKPPRDPKDRAAAVKPAAIGVLAVLLAVLPLAAQYVHQRGLVSGLESVALVPPASHAAPVRTPVRRHAGSHPHKKTRVKPHHARVAHKAPHHPAARRIAAVHRLARAHARKARRAVWKFAPSMNPYLNHRRWRRVIARAHARTRPQNRFGQVARLLVTSYLHDVVRGNNAGALQHLGMPRSAAVSNISERHIVARDSRVRVVAVKSKPAGAKVEVDITGRTGEYFEVFSVTHDGPAARISDRYYIPVNRTAEKRAAKLLATDGH